MKTETRKVYFCEFCTKHNLSASSISRHEKYCPSNPENKHKCFDHCRHLERKQIFNSDRQYFRTEFTCLKTENKMYSFLLEKVKSIWPYHIKTDGLTRMPLQCDLFHQMSYDQMEERYYKEEQNII